MGREYAERARQSRGSNGSLSTTTVWAYPGVSTSFLSGCRILVNCALICRTCSGWPRAVTTRAQLVVQGLGVGAQRQASLDGVLCRVVVARVAVDGGNLEGGVLQPRDQLLAVHSCPGHGEVVEGFAAHEVGGSRQFPKPFVITEVLGLVEMG